MNFTQIIGRVGVILLGITALTRKE